MRLAIAFLLTLSTAKSIGQECGREAGSGDIPILGYFEQKGNSLVNIRVPAMEGMECEMWCYEQENMNAAVEHHTENTGALILLHKNGKSTITSRFVPSTGAVDIYVTVTGPTEEDVLSVGALNPCWQFEKSSTFSSADREKYVEDFVARCFVILDSGLTLMKDTKDQRLNNFPISDMDNEFYIQLVTQTPRHKATKAQREVSESRTTRKPERKATRRQALRLSSCLSALVVNTELHDSIKSVSYLVMNPKRIPGTREPKDDKANLLNPWIQEYIPIWRRHPGQTKGQRGRSPDRPVYPIIGCTSRDGKYLAAIAWPETMSLGQVWHHCVHPRPRIVESYDREGNEIRSRARIYFMENDGEKLIAAFRRHFPHWARPDLGRTEKSR